MHRRTPHGTRTWPNSPILIDTSHVQRALIVNHLLLQHSAVLKKSLQSYEKAPIQPITRQYRCVSATSIYSSRSEPTTSFTTSHHIDNRKSVLSAPAYITEHSYQHRDNQPVGQNTYTSTNTRLTTHTSSTSPMPSRSNSPECTCHSGSCPLHNGTWALLRRKGWELLSRKLFSLETQITLETEEQMWKEVKAGDVLLDIEEVWDAELEWRVVRTMEKEMEAGAVRQPSVKEVARVMQAEGWNLGSEVWQWG